jgi:hypothetical protein
MGIDSPTLVFCVLDFVNKRTYPSEFSWDETMRNLPDFHRDILPSVILGEAFPIKNFIIGIIAIPSAGFLRKGLAVIG